MQEESSQRINRVEFVERDNIGYPWSTEIPREGWSGWVLSAFNDRYNAPWLHKWYCALRFHITGGEVRPKNTAVRIWKHTA